MIWKRFFKKSIKPCLNLQLNEKQKMFLPKSLQIVQMLTYFQHCIWRTNCVWYCNEHKYTQVKPKHLSFAATATPVLSWSNCNNKRCLHQLSTFLRLHKLYSNIYKLFLILVCLKNSFHFTPADIYCPNISLIVSMCSFPLLFLGFVFDTWFLVCIIDHTSEDTFFNISWGNRTYDFISVPHMFL